MTPANAGTDRTTSRTGARESFFRVTMKFMSQNEDFVVLALRFELSSDNSSVLTDFLHAAPILTCADSDPTRDRGADRHRRMHRFLFSVLLRADGSRSPRSISKPRRAPGSRSSDSNLLIEFGGGQRACLTSPH